MFLSKCRKYTVIPKGLVVKNPLKNTFNTAYSEKLCRKFSEKIRNHLISVLYSKQGKLNSQVADLTDRLNNHPSISVNELETIKRSTNNAYHQHLHKLKVTKDKKFSSLIQTTGHNHHNQPGSHQPDNIVNLSNLSLSPVERSVLSHGLKFCPTKQLDKTELCGDIESFFRRLRLKEYFHKPNSDESSSGHTTTLPQNPSCKSQDSIWTPPEGRNSKLDLYINCFRNRVRSEIINTQCKPHYNLSRAERNAVNSLRTNQTIVIKQADKGGATVIMNKSDYLREAVRQLSDTKFYTKLQSDPTMQYKSELKSVIRTFPDNIREDTVSLIPQDPRPGTFYLLPKIHKPGNPGRPIIWGIGTITEGISGYIDTTL
ncbi:uncharacterized protein [Ptychodera flava]|uniref:uncharacterized protein n=1 Tax=Ptychodera flava TaxID=63121 RepID=UPI00396A645F